MRVATAATMAGLLLGCATAAQRQSEAIGTNTKTVVAGAQACVTAIYTAPEAAPLRPHLPFDVRELTLAQLSDQSRLRPRKKSTRFFSCTPVFSNVKRRH